tara:strand:+ start:425 stop:1039 length:615 start_codon:yes stop_codon:yes gene_type:complete
LDNVRDKLDIKNDIKTSGDREVKNGKRDNKLVLHEQNYVERVFIKYKNDIHRYLNSIVRSDDDAHDLLQETYLKVCSRKHIDKLSENIKSYLFVVATNVAKDFIRKKVSHHELKHVPISSVEIEATDASPESMAEWNRSLRSIKKTLLQLDGRSRKIFIMRRFMGHNTADIAAHFSVSKRTVERDLIFALERIKSDLNKQTYDD